MNWDSWLLFAKDLTSCYDSKSSTGNKEKFGRDLQSPFHLVLNISLQRREELSSLGCLGVTTSQGRETVRWGISERNHFRRSLFTQLGCRRLCEPPLSYPACAAASYLSTSGPWGLDHAGICQVCALRLESRNLGFCFSCTVHSTQPSAEVLSQCSLRSWCEAHPNPAEALIVVEALILTRQFPAKWDPELPTLQQKQEQGFSTTGILRRVQALPNISEGTTKGLLQLICRKEQAQNRFVQDAQNYDTLAQCIALRFLLKCFHLQEASLWLPCQGQAPTLSILLSLLWSHLLYKSICF